MEIKELVSGLKAHVLEGMVFHDQMAQYFEFLGLHGYAKMHEYHYAEETHGYRKLIHEFFEEYDMLIPKAQMNRSDVIPDGWYSYRGEDVDTSTKLNAIRTGMSRWVDWEEDTKTIYREAYRQIPDTSLARIVACMFMDADEEVSCAKKKLEQVEAYDLNTIMTWQDEIYERYKDKIINMF